MYPEAWGGNNEMKFYSEMLGFRLFEEKKAIQAAQRKSSPFFSDRRMSSRR